MNKLHPIFWILIISALFISVPESSNSLIYIPDYSSCIKTSNAGISGSAQQSIRFFNGCVERLYINVCVQDSSGLRKLYRSPRTVPVGGNYTVSAPPFVTFRKVTWNAAPFPPPVPDMCQDAY